VTTIEVTETVLEAHVSGIEVTPPPRVVTLESEPPLPVQFDVVMSGGVIVLDLTFNTGLPGPPGPAPAGSGYAKVIGGVLQEPAVLDLTTVRTAQFTPLELGNLGAAKTLDWSLAAFQHGTLDQSCVITINAFPGVGRYQLHLANVGGFAVTWAGTAYSAARWINASAPPAVNTAVGGETIITFFWDGVSACQVLGKVGAA
jgi:hypothetical protein